METKTSYRYQASSKSEFTTLLNLIIDKNAVMTFNPDTCTAIVTVSDENIISEIGQAIDEMALNVHIIPTEDIEYKNFDQMIEDVDIDRETLRSALAEFISTAVSVKDKNCSKLKEKDFIITEITKERDQYRTWWSEANRHNDRVRKQVEAISTLVSSIFPK